MAKKSTLLVPFSSPFPLNNVKKVILIIVKENSFIKTKPKNRHIVSNNEKINPINGLIRGS